MTGTVGDDNRTGRYVNEVRHLCGCLTRFDTERCHSVAIEHCVDHRDVKQTAGSPPHYASHPVGRADSERDTQMSDADTEPHEFVRQGWRWWLCRHCYAPRSLHPRHGWVRARPIGDHRYLSERAPHFREGW